MSEALNRRQIRTCRPRRRKSSVGQHGFDWLNAGNGLLRERKAERDRAQQFAVDVNRAAAHTLQNAGFGERTAAQTGQDNGLLWAEILEHAEDFDLELFDAVTLEDSPADAMETGMHVFEWEELLSAGKRR
jgi:hypothetical protein